MKSYAFYLKGITGLLSDPPKCANCGKPASKRCSKWYYRSKVLKVLSFTLQE